MGKSLASDRHSDGPDAPSSMHDPHDLPLSPISEASSGYFSTSVSTATLSDVSIACGDLTPTPNSQADPVASRHDNEDCLPTPVNASVAPVEAGLRSDRPRKEEDTQAAHRNGVTTSQQEAQLNATPPWCWVPPQTALSPSRRSKPMNSGLSVTFLEMEKQPQQKLTAWRS